MSQRNTQDVTAVQPDPAAAAAPVVQPENVEPAGAETSPARIDPAASASYLGRITENYSQYRATAQIPWGNAIAFNPGDPVPADREDLQQLLDDGLVEKVGGASSKSKSK